MAQTEIPGTRYVKAVAYFAQLQSIPIGIKLAAYPLERVRLLMQTQHVNKTYERASFSKATFQHGREPHQQLYDRQTQYPRFFVSKVCGGAATGIINSLIWGYPLDVVRQQLATKDSGSWRNGVKEVYGHHGLKGFYRGFLINAPGLMIFRGVQLGGWDIVKDFYGEEKWAQLGSFSRFAHGQMISLMGSVVSYPVDTIRRNLMSSCRNTSYSDILSLSSSNSTGLRGFLYAGFSARILTSVVNGALLESFDEWKRTKDA